MFNEILTGGNYKFSANKFAKQKYQLTHEQLISMKIF